MLKRIYNKGLSIVNSIIGECHLFLEKKGIVEPIKYTFYKKVENAVHVSHKYPVNFNEADKSLFNHYTNYNSAGEYIYALNFVNISERGVVFSKFTNFTHSFPHIIFRLTYGWLYILGQNLFLKKTKLPITKTYILIYDFWSAGNYYHWLVDTLPRLWIVREELKQTNYSLLLPENSPKFIKASLAYFEINHITYIKPTEFVLAENLLIPYYMAGSGHIHPPIVFEIKNYLLKKINLISSKKLVYVSRSRQKARLVINETDVIACVLGFGFEVIYFEDYSFEEQISIGKYADVMVTSHGANLTNCLFMKEGTKVLELIRSDKPNFCYWALCNAANVNYYYQLCKVVGNDHLLVDVDVFKLNLHQISNA